MENRDSYRDKWDHQRERDELAAKLGSEAATRWQNMLRQIAAPPTPAPAPARRDSDEPKVSAPVAAYLAEWFAR